MTNKFKYPRDYSFQVVLGPHENFNVLSLSGECICLDKERHFFFSFFSDCQAFFLLLCLKRPWSREMIQFA